MAVALRAEAPGEGQRIGREGDQTTGEHGREVALPAPCYDRRVLRRHTPLFWILPLLAGCSSETRVLDIEVVTGHETDAMTQEPAVANVVVKGTYAYEDVTIEAEAAPGGDLDFGEVDGSLPYTFEATGYDGAGNVVLRGGTVGGIVLDAVEGDTFQIFAQRVGAWARPPGQLTRGHTRAPAVSVGERYLLMTGGDPSQDAAASELYDLFAWAGAKGDTLPFAATTMWSDVTAVLALGSESGGEAAWLDENGISADPPLLPDGLTSFGELAGGSVTVSPEGRVFIVGATRTTTPADAVLEIAADGSLVVRRLVQKRAGAAVTWLDDVGLVVIGGSAEGKGVEVLAENAASFAARDFPADPTSGAGAAPSSLGTVILAGGTVGDTPVKTRLLDPRCTSGCAAEEVESATPAAALTRVAAYYVQDRKRILVVGDEPGEGGLTRAYQIDDLASTITELPLREPRISATSVPAPNGTLALMGGAHPDGTPALTVEMFFPE